MTLGNMRRRSVRWFAAICAAAMTTGCASSISKTLAKVSYKEKQLAQLMTRASEAADGAFVNAIVYQDQYNTARAEMRALRKAGEAKKCSPSDLNPTPVAPPD
jgi:hypothetical protein